MKKPTLLDYTPAFACADPAVRAGNLAAMMKIIAENPIEDKATTVHTGAEGPWDRDILHDRLMAWRNGTKGTDHEFVFDETARENGFQIRCPGYYGWPDGEQHEDLSENVNDSSIVYEENGWPRFSCKHNHCGEGAEHGKKTWLDLQNFYDPERKLHKLEREEVDLENEKFENDLASDAEAWAETSERMAKLARETAKETAKESEPTDPRAAFKKANTLITAQIDGIMNPPLEKGEKMPPERERNRDASLVLYKHLKTTGKLYNCGNVATYVDSYTHELIEITKGDPKFTRMMMNFGIGPEKLLDYFGKWMGAMATNSPDNQVYAMAYYDKHDHTLYVNEYDNNFLKIASDGTVTRHHNGEFDMLFRDGGENECDPLNADLSTLNAPQALRPGGLIQKEILDTILYDANGVGRDDAHIILMTSLLALFFFERVPSNPYIYLYGAGASMKSSLATKVGKLLQGHKFAPRPSTEDESKLKDMAMSMPFIVLDEANNLKKLMNLLKTLATGGTDTRRELYTTGTMRHTPYQARIWMTANTASLTNETISARMMIIDAGERTEAEPYRSEHYLIWTKEQRNALWTDLISRLSRAMIELRDADASGQGDLASEHRMSSFFIFGRAMAKQEGWEDEFLTAMRAMDGRQKVTSSEGNEILDLLAKLPVSYGTQDLLAREWCEIIWRLVDKDNLEMRRKAMSVGWVARQFSDNQHMLRMKFGMKTTINKKTHTTSYKFPKLDGSGVFRPTIGGLSPEDDPKNERV